MNFSFAKVWAADKDNLEEIEDNDQVDSWTQALEKIQAEQLRAAIQVEAASGRGRRKAAAAAKVGTREKNHNQQQMLMLHPRIEKDGR
jgi:hypothetical protein